MSEFIVEVEREEDGRGSVKCRTYRASWPTDRRTMKLSRKRRRWLFAFLPIGSRMVRRSPRSKASLRYTDELAADQGLPSSCRTPADWMVGEATGRNIAPSS